MQLWRDFKSFAFKGNVIDLAVAVMIGAAFNKIVTALVNDIIMPLVGVIMGSGAKFTDKFIVLKEAKVGDSYASLEQARAAGANVLAYGDFIQTIVDFLIIAFSIFMAITLTKRIRERQEKAETIAPEAPSTTDKLLMEIRDELKKHP
jgi:large conductance mechanosensitive channel